MGAARWGTVFFAGLAILTGNSAAKAGSPNPVMVELLETGLAIGGPTRDKLPAPTMETGLEDDEQKQVILGLTDATHSVSNLMTRSVRAMVAQKSGPDGQRPPDKRLRRIDVWFIAYGELDV